MINIRELLEDPSKLNADTLPELKALVEKYPFFQVVRLLYISNLYKLHSQDFGAELRKASSFVPDRTALFALTEGVNYTLPTHSNDINIETEDEGTRTISLIDRFLQEGGIETDEDDDSRREQPSQIDLLTDYATYLMQLDDQESKNSEKASSDAPKLKGAELIDSFIEENKGKQRVDIPDMDESEFSSPEFSVEEEEVYTENMVNIYIKQGRYQQALEILRKISLNNPKKSSNFAAQIYLLEVLLKQNQ
jgi:tetratricopeptide (TPR) repeat protein